MACLSKLAFAGRGARAGATSGAIASVVCICLCLAVQGELAFVIYESYVLPSFAFYGAVIGGSVGLAVGWRSAARPGRAAKSWRTGIGGLVGGALIVILATCPILGSPNEIEFWGEVLKVGSYGAVVGSAAAVSTASWLRYKPAPQNGLTPFSNGGWRW